jgi:hypothetical protein
LFLGVFDAVPFNKLISDSQQRLLAKDLCADENENQPFSYQDSDVLLARFDSEIVSIHFVPLNTNPQRLLLVTLENSYKLHLWQWNVNNFLWYSLGSLELSSNNEKRKLLDALCVPHTMSNTLNIFFFDKDTTEPISEDPNSSLVSFRRCSVTIPSNTSSSSSLNVPVTTKTTDGFVITSSETISLFLDYHQSFLGINGIWILTASDLCFYSLSSGNITSVEIQSICERESKVLQLTPNPLSRQFVVINEHGDAYLCIPREEVLLNRTDQYNTHTHTITHNKQTNKTNKQTNKITC